MTGGAPDPLLDRPWIGSDLQHFGIVIRFDYDQVRSAKSLGHQVCYVPKVGCHSNLHSFRFDGEREVVSPIMRNRKRTEVQRSDFEWRARFDGFTPDYSRGVSSKVTVSPGYIRYKHRRAGGLGYDPDSLHMINVFVGDYDAIQAGKVGSGVGHSGGGFFAWHPAGCTTPRAAA